MKTLGGMPHGMSLSVDSNRLGNYVSNDLNEHCPHDLACNLCHIIVEMKSIGIQYTMAMALLPGWGLLCVLHCNLRVQSIVDKQGDCCIMICHDTNMPRWWATSKTVWR